MASAVLAIPAASAFADSGSGGSGSSSSAPATLTPPSDATCPGDPLQPFLPWGDDGTYTLAPGGDFEGGATDWFLGDGATLADGNEPYFVSNGADAGVLSLANGSSATSSPICITRDHPNFRFFALSEGSAGTRLRVEVLYKDRKGKVRSPNIGVLTPDGSGDPTVTDDGSSDPTAYNSDWQVSPAFPVIANEFLKLGETASIELRFTVIGGRSTWSVDDVYVDPRHRS